MAPAALAVLLSACGAVNTGAENPGAATCASRGACQGSCRDCNHLSADGCETDVTTIDNCGACGLACDQPAHASPTCTAAVCGMGSCDRGWADCNSLLADGCEVETDLDPRNCGGCGLLCSPANATASCAAGTCGIATCDAGYSDCDHAAANGCEAHPVDDPRNCGACGNACPGGFECRSGGCSAGVTAWGTFHPALHCADLTPGAGNWCFTLPTNVIAPTVCLSGCVGCGIVPACDDIKGGGVRLYVSPNGGQGMRLDYPARKVPACRFLNSLHVGNLAWALGYAKATVNNSQMGGHPFCGSAWIDDNGLYQEDLGPPATLYVFDASFTP